MMADAAAEAEDRLADDLRRTDLHGVVFLSNSTRVHLYTI